MAICPECGTSSRTDPEAMTAMPVFLASPVSTYSLAGVMVKATTRWAYRITCRCGWTVTGQIVDGHLIVTPTPTTEGGTP